MRVGMVGGLLLAVASGGMALAQDAPEDGNSGPGGRGLHAGSFTVLPTLGLSLGFDSNTTLTNDVRTDSWFSRVSPAVRAMRGSDENRLTLTADADFATYSGSSHDNYQDYGAGLVWLYSPALRHAFGFDAGVHWTHDQRGTAAREGDLALIPRDVDRYRSTQVGGTYRFGAPGARGQLELDAHLRDRQYLNNRDYTTSRDESETAFGAGFLWRVGAKTQAEVRVEESSFDYDSATLDNSEQRYYVGMRFDATARTSGEVLFGHANKDFDDPTRPDYSGSSWRAGLKYRPRTYSTFSITTNRETDETNGAGDYILRRDVVLGWSHSWNQRLSTGVDGGFSDEQHQPDERTDRMRFIGVSANYEFREWLRAGASYRTYDRTSTDNEFDYNRNLLLFTVEASL